MKRSAEVEPDKGNKRVCMSKHRIPYLPSFGLNSTLPYRTMALVGNDYRDKAVLVNSIVGYTVLPLESVIDHPVIFMHRLNIAPKSSIVGTFTQSEACELDTVSAHIVAMDKRCTPDDIITVGMYFANEHLKRITFLYLPLPYAKPGFKQIGKKTFLSDGYYGGIICVKSTDMSTKMPTFQYPEHSIVLITYTDTKPDLKPEFNETMCFKVPPETSEINSLHSRLIAMLDPQSKCC